MRIAPGAAALVALVATGVSSGQAPAVPAFEVATALRLEIREEIQASEGPGGPTLYAALRKQLGLRLLPRRVPREVMVIDRASMPSEN